MRLNPISVIFTNDVHGTLTSKRSYGEILNARTLIATDLLESKGLVSKRNLPEVLVAK